MDGGYPSMNFVDNSMGADLSCLRKAHRLTVQNYGYSVHHLYIIAVSCANATSSAFFLFNLPHNFSP